MDSTWFRSACQQLCRDAAGMDQAFPFSWFFPKSDDLSVWQGTIMGPDNSPYCGLVFHLQIILTSSYPFKSPKISFKTKMFHSNISSITGEISINVLKEHWSPSLTVSKLLISICSLLCDPNVHNGCALESGIAQLYLSDREEHDRLATISALENGQGFLEYFKVQLGTDFPPPPSYLWLNTIPAHVALEFNNWRDCILNDAEGCFIALFQGKGILEEKSHMSPLRRGEEEEEEEEESLVKLVPIRRCTKYDGNLPVRNRVSSFLVHPALRIKRSLQSLSKKAINQESTKDFLEGRRLQLLFLREKASATTGFRFFFESNPSFCTLGEMSGAGRSKVLGFKLWKYTESKSLVGTIEWAGEVDVNGISLDDFIFKHSTSANGDFIWSVEILNARQSNLNSQATVTLLGVKLSPVPESLSNLEAQIRGRYRSTHIEYDTACGLVRFVVNNWI